MPMTAAAFTILFVYVAFARFHSRVVTLTLPDAGRADSSLWNVFALSSLTAAYDFSFLENTLCTCASVARGN
jgi:hypothetical protein